MKHSSARQSPRGSDERMFATTSSGRGRGDLPKGLIERFTTNPEERTNSFFRIGGKYAIENGLGLRNLIFGKLLSTAPSALAGSVTQPGDTMGSV